MTPNKRIFLNIVATYGRSLYALACGIFTSRWVLMALGHEDYGLYGVVGGLVGFITIFNGLLATAVSRFYAVSVGAANGTNDKAFALQECRAWFSSAVLVHTLVPLVLMVVGEPLGEYAIRAGWVVIPPDRLAASLWVFRFSCIASFVAMVSVPYSAMYGAKQLIAELTVYGFVTSTLNVSFFYYMATHPAVWLAKYAAWMSAVSVLPTVIIAVRAYFIFPECRLVPREIFNFARLRQLAVFAGWQAFGCFGAMLRGQGVALLLNQHVEFGPMRNSSMTVANSLASHTETLSGAMVGAFQPAIANAYGAKDFERMRALAFRACKFGTLLLAIFILPLALELPMILKIWLKDPPVYTAGFCWCVLALYLVDRMTVGHMVAVNATGKIAVYQAFLGGSLILTLPVAWLFLFLNLGVYSVGWAMFLMTMVCAWGRVYFARSIAGMSGRYWMRTILLPLAFLFGIALFVGYLPHFVMQSGFLRVIVTTLVCEVVLLGLSWTFVLDTSEKAFVIEKISRYREKFRR
jgi:hypothetical protein